MARKFTWPRGTCSKCGRSIALDSRGCCLLDHNPVPSGGGGLFRMRRISGNGLCTGSPATALPATRTREQS